MNRQRETESLIFRIILIGLAATLVGCSTSSTSNTGLPAELKNLIGVKGREGEQGLKQAGFEHRNTAKTEVSAISHWRGKDGACVEVTTTDGRYEKMDFVAADKCQDENKAVASSGEAGAMRTVCGVIVNKKPTRYLCEVVENRQGTTKLKMPDTSLELTWQPGGKVSVLQEGTTASLEAKYSESEGETDIFVDERTFFYISNPGAAAMEVRTFKP